MSTAIRDELTLAAARRLLTEHREMLNELLQVTRCYYKQDRESGLFELGQNEIEVPLEWESFPLRLSGTLEIAGKRRGIDYTLDRVENRYAVYTITEN